jgi:oligoribonuclease
VRSPKVRVVSTSSADRIVWIDCEMTGLSPETDALIEVACLVTDNELNVLGDGVSVVIKPPEGALVQMNDVVVAMHTSSGLLDELAEGMTIADAQQVVLDYVRTHVPEPGKAPLGGNSVGVDRLFLSRDMPELIEHLHYRVIDVSSLKELARRWFPRIHFAAPAKTGNHRALGDIRDSIDELRYYRAIMFVAEPGPTSVEAAATAKQITDSRTSD